MSDVETKTITVTTTWEQTDTFEVPIDTDTTNYSTLDQLMEIIRADVDGRDDVTPDTAELVDWGVSG